MSALIWLAIVGVWGFVLIPMWLRRHDGALEQRSAEKFSTAMRVLSRRGGRGQPVLLEAASLGPLDADDDGDLADDADDLDFSADDPRRADLGTPGEAAGDRMPPAVAGTSPRAAASPGAGAGRATANPTAAGHEAGRPGELTKTAADRPAGAQERGRLAARPAVPSRGLPGDERARSDLDQTAHTVPVGPTRPVTRSRQLDPERRALLRLRRQRLSVLVAAVPVTIGLAIGLAGMWIVVQLLVDVGLGVYVSHLRRSARTERRLAASRAARDQRIADERAARRAARPGGPRGASAPGAHARGVHGPGEASALSASGQSPSGVPAGAGLQGRPHVWTGGGPSPEYAPVRLSSDRDAPLTEEELATARADTVDLGGYSPAPAASAGLEPAQPDDGYTNNVRVTAPRPAGRPNVRPPTSRPGRVQVNPPGTYGGLTAPPPAPAAAAPAATGDGASVGTEDAEVRPLRPAVGD